MPALKVFGRRWYLGSDDLVTPSLLELTIRILWFVALIVVYFLQVDTNTCSDGYKIKLFYVGTMLFLVVYTIINVAIAIISARGSIMDVYPRRHIDSLLYLKFAIFVPEVIWAILATWWMFTLPADCGPVAIILAKAAVITEWIIIASVLASVYLMYDPLGRRPLKKRSLKDYEKMWHRRCRFMCCCLRRDENKADAFEEVATLFTRFFQGRDLVLTDILAGVILLSAKQRQERRINNKRITDISEADTLPIRRCYRLDYQGTPFVEKEGKYITKTETDRQLGNIGYRDSSVDKQFSRNDSGADTQTDVQSCSENSVNVGQENRFYVESEKTRLYDRKKRVPHYGASSPEDANSLRRTGSGPSLPRIGSVASSTGSWMSIDGELCPGFTPPRGPKTWMTLENAAYYLRYATAIYGSSNYGGCYNCSDRIPLCRKYRWCRNDPHLPADILKGDNYWECEAASVLLYSHLDREDIIYADLDNQVFKTPYFVGRDDKKKVVVIAIRGTMSAGDALTDLTAQGEDIKVEHLPRGNVHKGIQKVAKKIKNQLENEIDLKSKIPQGYGLVITGHSLGAGVAAVLSLLIRDQYPDVICYAFSPPGGLVSLSLSFYLQDFVLTCFLGMDVVARLGVINMEKLKSDLLAVIKNSRLPKYKILSNGILSVCCGCLEINDDILLDDTQTAELSGSVTSDWEIVVWIDDQETMVEEHQDSKDDLAERTCRKGTSTGEPGGYQDSTRTLSQDSFASYDSRISTCSNSSRNSKTSGKHRRDNSDADSIISDSHAKWRRKQKNKKVGLAATDPLYLPGQILYLYEDEELAIETCCHSETVYKARWARAEEFDSIQLHSKMMYHHNPYTVDEALQQILNQGLAPSAPGTDVFESQYDYSPSLGKSFDSGIRCEGYADSVDAQKARELNTVAENTTKVFNQAISAHQVAKPSTRENVKPDDINCAEEFYTNLTLEEKQTNRSESKDTSVMAQNTMVCCKELPVDIKTHFLERTNTLREQVVDNRESTGGIAIIQSRENPLEITNKHSENDRKNQEMLEDKENMIVDNQRNVTCTKDDQTQDSRRLTDVLPLATTVAPLYDSGDAKQSGDVPDSSNDPLLTKIDNAMMITEPSFLQQKRYDAGAGATVVDDDAKSELDSSSKTDKPLPTDHQHAMFTTFTTLTPVRTLATSVTTLDTSVDISPDTTTVSALPSDVLGSSPPAVLVMSMADTITSTYVTSNTSTIATTTAKTPTTTANTPTTTANTPTAAANISITTVNTPATTPTIIRAIDPESDDDELVYFTI